MPALVNNSVGSLAGTSDDECTRRCPLLSKKRRKVSRVSEPERRRIGSIQFSKAGSPRRHGGTAKGEIEHKRHGGNEGLNCQSRLTLADCTRHPLQIAPARATSLVSFVSFRPSRFGCSPCLRVSVVKSLHGDHDHRGVVLEALFAVLAYGLHQAALDFFGRASAVAHYDFLHALHAKLFVIPAFDFGDAVSIEH